MTAETFLVAWRRLDRVPAGQEAAFWLLATARRILANRRRAARRDEHMTATGPRPEVPDHAESVAELQKLAAAFSKLSERDRETIALTAWDGLRPRDAARIVQTTAAVFSLRLHRARRRLAALLEDAVESEMESP